MELAILSSEGCVLPLKGFSTNRPRSQLHLLFTTERRLGFTLSVPAGAWLCAGYLPRMVQRCLHRSTHFILEKYVLFSPLRQPCMVVVYIRPRCWVCKAFIALNTQKRDVIKMQIIYEELNCPFILSPGSVNDWKSPSGPKRPTSYLLFFHPCSVSPSLASNSPTRPPPNTYILFVKGVKMVLILKEVYSIPTILVEADKKY